MAEADGREPHPVAGLEPGSRLGRVPQDHRRAPDQVPPAGRLGRVDGGLPPGDRDAARRDAWTRGRAARQGEGPGKRAKVRETRGEPEQEDAIDGAGMALDDVVRRQAQAIGDVTEVGAVGAAVARRDTRPIRRSASASIGRATVSPVSSRSRARATSGAIASGSTGTSRLE